MLGGTVLSVKSYPTEEISIKLNGRPVVLSLRNVNIFTPASQGVCGTNENVLRTVRDICEGMSLILYDIGIWNVKTTAFHYASVYLEKDTDDRRDKDLLVAGSVAGDVFISAGPTVMGSAVLPKRRKHNAMSLT